MEVLKQQRELKNPYHEIYELDESQITHEDKRPDGFKNITQ